MKKICDELQRFLAAGKEKHITFDVCGGCGIDTSLGTELCMESFGIWFKFCPFCGSEIIRIKTEEGFIWYEKETAERENQMKILSEYIDLLKKEFPQLQYKNATTEDFQERAFIDDFSIVVGKVTPNLIKPVRKFITKVLYSKIEEELPNIITLQREL